jgi:hypothetical protein
MFRARERPIRPFLNVDDILSQQRSGYIPYPLHYTQIWFSLSLSLLELPAAPLAILLQWLIELIAVLLNTLYHYKYQHLTELYTSSLEKKEYKLRDCRGEQRTERVEKTKRKQQLKVTDASNIRHKRESKGQPQLWSGGVHNS